MLYNIIIVVITIICALLTLVVLLQNGQGQGLSGIGGGGGLDAGAGGLGARRTADLLSKATTILGGAFLVLCVLANFAIDRQTQANSVLQQYAPLNDISAPSNTQSAVPVQTPPPAATDDGGGSDENN
jgi:preprotein translocase subunit SecG